MIFILTLLFVVASHAQEQKTVHAFSLADAVNYAQKNNKLIINLNV